MGRSGYRRQIRGRGKRIKCPANIYIIVKPIKSRLDLLGYIYLCVFIREFLIICIMEIFMTFICCLEHEILSAALLAGSVGYLHGLLPSAVGQKQGTGSFASGQ